MAELTIDQQKAVALAKARQRAAEAQSSGQQSGQDPALSGYVDATDQGRNSVMGKIDSAVRGAADMLTFGLADEFAAKMADMTGIGGEKGQYDKNLAEQRAIDRQDAAQRPGYRIGGQITGALMGGAGLANRGVTLIGRLPANASLALKSGVGAAEGAAYGGSYGYGSGEGINDRVKNAAVGGTMGALIGGAVPIVAKGVSSAYRTIMDSRAATEAAKKAGTSPEVARMLADTLGADGSLGPTGRANMARAGNEAMLADAGPNAKAVLDTTIQRGGPGAVLARSRIDERVARGAKDLTGALDNALGSPQGVTAARTAIRQGTAPSRSAAYDAAYSAPIDYSAPKAMEIEDIVRNRLPASAIRRANELMRLEGHQSQQILANIADDGTVSFERLPDVRQLDYITRGLNDLAKSGEGQGALGGQTGLGQAYERVSGAIRGRLRELVPEYATALDTAADPIRRSQAVDLGSKLLSPSMRRDQVSEAVSGMSKAERDALAQGIRSQIDDAVANVVRTVQDGNTTAREGIKALRDLSSRANREKIATAIGDQKAKALFDQLDQISTSFELRAAVAENSKTYARQAISSGIDDITAPGAIGKVAQGEPVQGAKKVVQALTGQSPSRIKARQDAIYSNVADYLTRPAANSIPAYQAMQNYGSQSAVNQVRANAIAQALSRGRHLVYPTSGLVAEALARRQSQR
jgi:hypothetical protein